MIARLRGTRAGLSAAGLVLDVNGVGYLVQATPSVLRREGEELTVETYLVVREDALQLYGFASADERAWIRGVLREHLAEHFPEMQAP